MAAIQPARIQSDAKHAVSSVYILVREDLPPLVAVRYGGHSFPCDDCNFPCRGVQKLSAPPTNPSFLPPNSPFLPLRTDDLSKVKQKHCMHARHCSHSNHVWPVPPPLETARANGARASALTSPFRFSMLLGFSFCLLCSLSSHSLSFLLCLTRVCTAP